MGGEKLHLDVFCNNCEGSPPRGRGKVSTCCLLSPLDRITPAWAGKRYYPFAVILLDRDHPRVGGEKHSGSCRTLTRSGSPPRGRGKAFTTVSGFVTGRITPAWAGKSWMISMLMFGVLGSPPRGRGKGDHLEVKARDGGITPAWAGKSGCRGCACPRRRDHPRVGGEKLHEALPYLRDPGSPPRGRGKD